MNPWHQKTKIYHLICKSAPPVPILSQLNLLNTTTLPLPAKNFLNVPFDPI
jgi:hypothetical protein